MAPPKAPPRPDATSLHDAALAYLARYAATKAGLRRVLTRRVSRWAESQPDQEQAAPVIAAAHEAIGTLIEKLSGLGVLDDAAFAGTRARSMVRAGRSRRAVQAKLIAKGVDPELARATIGANPESELAAALVLARKRRIGPWRSAEPEDQRAARQRELGVLARAGFDRDTAERTLDTDLEEADRRIHALRADQPLDPDAAQDGA